MLVTWVYALHFSLKSSPFFFLQHQRTITYLPTYKTMSTRKPHRKSRTGCLNCKKRHMKVSNMGTVPRKAQKPYFTRLKKSHKITSAEKSVQGVRTASNTMWNVNIWLLNL
jgi:hypothetical protein